MKEKLIGYVRRVMDEKNFGVRDVERNSGKKITASHISKVLNGSAANLTADKIVGLALGLKVDPQEVFSVISGYPLKEANAPDLVRFTDLIRRVATNPILLEAVQELALLDAKHLAKLLSSLRFVNSRTLEPMQKKNG